MINILDLLSDKTNYIYIERCNDRMKNKKYHTVGTISKPNRNLVERDKSIPIMHTYMAAHFLDLVQTLH